MPSSECPSREDVLNTPSELRWQLWWDVNCTDGCHLVKCSSGRAAPCCVKRLNVKWPVPCPFLEHGCYRVGSMWQRKGWVVIDKKREPPAE